MALPVLDGNQSATTLSSVVTGGEHIVAHSVVCLGSTAIANITNAVSGSVVSVSNFPASQSTTFGAVTGSVSVLNFPSTQTVAGTVTANVLGYDPYNGVYPSLPITRADDGIAGADNVVKVAIATELGGVNDSAPLPISGTVTVSNAVELANALIDQTAFYGSLDVNIGGSSIIQSISGTVTVGNSVTIGSLPAISGTVTVGGFSSVSVGSGAILIAGDRSGSITPIPIDSGSGQVGVQLKQSSGPSIDPISQTNGLWVRQANGSSITVGNSVTIGSLPAISGTVTANAILQNSNSVAQAFIDESNSYGSLSVVLSGSAGNIGVVGTVTAAAPNGSLTTRFGTPTTANVSFATTAVTKSDRKYLLIQNVTTGSNVITVGIGFTPTTTQGIQLTAGAGITFESSYIPTGAVYVLSSVTASNFTILEA